MSDIYKLQYNGMTLAYPGWDGYVSWEQAMQAYNLTLQTDGHGTITATTTTGYPGDTSILSTTANTHYAFQSYSITGGLINGNTFTFENSDATAQANFSAKVYTITLQNDGHGTVTANKLTATANQTVTLTPTYNTYYRFNNYAVTGGSVNGNTLTVTANCTAKANFKVNAFTASGTFEKGSNVSVSTKNTSVQSANIPAKYAVTSYHTTNTPTAWYNTSNRWKPNGASAYKITLHPIMQVTSVCNITANNTTPRSFTGCSLIGSTATQSQTFSTTGYPASAATGSKTYSYNKTFTSTTQNVNYGISGKIQASRGNASNATTVTYVAANTTGTWTATGYAP